MLVCRTLVITTALCSTLAAANAQAKSIKSLDKVTVYATKSAQDTFDVPAIVDVIDADAPGNATASTSGELLEFTPSVEVTGGPRRNGESVSIRGFDDEAIITLIDGRRQNFEAEHDGQFFLDPSLLKQVEVIKGAGSSIYGGGAIGGVLAFETKDAADFLAPGETSGMTSSFSFRTANQELSPMHTGYARFDNWDLLGSATYRRSDDIELGNDTELQAEDRILSGLFKAGYDLSDVDTLKFQYSRFHNDGVEPNDGQDFFDSTENPLVSKEVTDNQFGVKYEHNDPVDKLFRPSVHVYYNITEVEEEDILGGTPGRISSRRINTLGTNLENKSIFEFGERQTHTFTYGGEYYRDVQDGFRNVATGSTPAGINPGAPDAHADNYGLFVQDEIALEEVAELPGKFLIIPAVRFDQYESEAEDGNMQDENDFSPKIAVTYKPTENYMVYSSYAKAFRAPDLTELYASGQHFFNNNFVPNPNLKPEKVTTLEVGGGIDFQDILTDKDRVKVKGAWHTSDGEDFITQEVTLGTFFPMMVPGTTEILNIPNAKLRGWEIEGEYEINPVTLKLSLSQVTAKNDDTGEYLTNSTPLTLITDIGYDISAVDSTVGWRSRFANENNKVNVNSLEGGTVATDGYSVHDLYYRWEPKGHGLDDLTFDLGVDNVFDKSYSRVYSTLTEEGRSIAGRVTWKW